MSIVDAFPGLGEFYRVAGALGLTAVAVAAVWGVFWVIRFWLTGR